MKLVKEPSPEGPSRKIRPIRSMVLQFVRELREMEVEELATKAGFKKSTLLAFEEGTEVPGPETLERLMEALEVSPSILEDLLRLAEEIREGGTPDRWFGPVLFTGKEISRARELGQSVGKLTSRSFQEHLLQALAQERAEDHEVAGQIGDTPESVS
jgi:transcriptional regulator with XRE-family HTH domain